MEIAEIIVYFIKVIAIQGILFTFYWLALRHKTNHALNRIFLLSTLLLSLLIPFIEHPVPETVEPMLEVAMFEWMAEPMEFVATEIEATYETRSFPVWTALGYIYFGLILFFLGRSSFHLYLLQKIKKQCEYVKERWFKLFKTTQSRPFSFFSSVFIPKEIFGTDSFDQILAHECVHVRRLHSLDRLLVDFLVSLFWFNPFIYLYRNALIEVHEYQADAEVVKKYKDLVGYQEILFAQLQPAPYSGLVSHFNFSTIKKRIVMMNKTKNTNQSRLVYVLTLPIVAMVLFAFTSTKSEKSIDHIADKIEEFTGPFDIITSVNVLSQVDKYRPSILPLRTDSRFKMTSSFGMRQDPIDNTRKQHKGIDLAVALGTEVLATADGIVEELSSNPKGPGHMITLNHGDKYKTRYSQLSEFKVVNGDKVIKGQVIALVGSSGRSSGPHLHYEVYEGETLLNPIDYIKNFKFASLSNQRDSKAVSKTNATPVNNIVGKVSSNAELAEAEMEIAENQRAEAEEELVLAKVHQETAETEVKEAEEREHLTSLAKVEEEAQAQKANAIAHDDMEHVKKIKIEISDKTGKPLFVLDGEVLQNGSIDEMNPAEIESINVIKGEAAIKKYGDAGKNGVIEITRKSDLSKNKDKEIKVKVKNKRKNKTK